MADGNKTPHVVWADDLRHNPRPNEAPGIQIAPLRREQPQPPASRALPAGVGTMDRPASTPRPHTPPAEASYYDISMLQRPVWKWEIASYFFLGGLSAGAYTLARIAERIGRGRYQHLTRLGTYTAFATFLPCPLLLIHDLGDRKRFHHMLRVWKPGTPMNLGTWSIVAYSGMVTVSVLGEFLRDRAAQPRLVRHPAGTLALTLHDLAGVPFALMVAGYTGVLLSCTSNPLWCKNTWLGPLFSASSIASGAEAVSLMLDGSRRTRRSRSSEALMRIDTVAHVAEFAASAAFTREAGDKARPLRRGRMSTVKTLSTAAMITAEVIKLLPLKGRARTWARVASATLGLTSAFLMRWAIIYGGHEAAADPHLARVNSRAVPSTAGRTSLQPSQLKAAA